MEKQTEIKVSFENIKALAIEKFGDKLYKWEKSFNNCKWVWVRANEKYDETLTLNSKNKCVQHFLMRIWVGVFEQT